MTTAPAQPGPLKSDHINYLILRYLQEAGHEASAHAFYRDWRRPAEYRDPEDLPFAQTVQRHELVSVIQDGLHHDELVSRVRKGERRFNFTTNGSATSGGSRPGTAGKGKGRMEQMRRGGNEDFPTPPPKRQRRSEEGHLHLQTNGLAEPMEVDTVSPSAGDAEEDAEGASPAVQTPEPEIVEVPERYDSMDVAVQTDGKMGPKTSTLYWRVGKPDAAIMHSAFSPAKESRTLFTAGEGMSQFYDLPGDYDGGVEKIGSVDDGCTGPGSVVTACAWRPDGHALTFAVDMAREIGVGGKTERRQVIKVHDVKSSRTTEYHSPPLLEPQGLVIALRYSWDGSHLLAVRTNALRATVEIWTTEAEPRNGAIQSADVAAWRIFEDQVLDAVWISPFEFVVCGGGGLLEKFKMAVSDNSTNAEQTHTSKNIRMRGLESCPAPSSSALLQQANFDKLRASTLKGPSASDASIAFVAVASDDPAIVQGFSDSSESRSILLPEGHERITALAFQPPRHGFEGKRFALAQESGRVAVHQLGDDSKGPIEATCQLVDGSPALALAWSPEGAYLAVSGVDVVQIWEASMLIHPSHQGASGPPGPVVTWRRDKSATLRGGRNGEHAVNGDADEAVSEPCLSWSSDGESLALAAGNELAVIRFRPPLHGSNENGAAHINGHGR